jgi:hypothetical protein
VKTLFVNEYIRGSVSQEETLWSVLAERMPDASALALSSFGGDVATYIKERAPATVVYNALLGELPFSSPRKKIAVLQDNFIVMEQRLKKTVRQRVGNLIRGGSFYKRMIAVQRKALEQADVIVAVSESVARAYGVSAEIIPIGTNAELFRPMDNRAGLRAQHGIPGGEVRIFVGSTHAVKGFDLLRAEMKKNPDVFYIVVLKDDTVPVMLSPNAKIFQKVSQTTLAELYNCADEYVGFSRVETLWLAPIEAMFCDTPVRVSKAGVFEDWTPKKEQPRRQAFEKGLDRAAMLSRWEKLLA